MPIKIGAMKEMDLGKYTILKTEKLIIIKII
jgi:hypothetical protein